MLQDFISDITERKLTNADLKEFKISVKRLGRNENMEFPTQESIIDSYVAATIISIIAVKSMNERDYQNYMEIVRETQKGRTKLITLSDNGFKKIKENLRRCEWLKENGVLEYNNKNGKSVMKSILAAEDLLEKSILLLIEKTATAHFILNPVTEARKVDLRPADTGEFTCV